MGCGASRPICEAEFLQAHSKQRSNLIEPDEVAITYVWYPADRTNTSKHISLINSIVAVNTSSFAKAERSSKHDVDFLATLSEGPLPVVVGTPIQVSSSMPDSNQSANAFLGQPADTTAIAWQPNYRWPIRLHGTNSIFELRLQMTAQSGEVIGLLLTKAVQDNGGPGNHARMFLYSVVPLHPNQPAAVELRPDESSGEWEWKDTKKALKLDSGQPLYAWAKVEDAGTFYGEHRIFYAEKTGKFCQTYAYKGSAPSFGAVTEKFNMTKDGKGCLMTSRSREASALPEEDPVDGWSLAVAPGIDAALMLGAAVLMEKASFKEHLAMHGSGGGAG
mmetsp:Transcript_5532/g.9874  ORF Transcript_5532/g.9874 Transcript_5532/m.9874 type:complete len:333 (-) Transcript_5532:273-1271(-)